jgi:hypothetical protein
MSEEQSATWSPGIEFILEEIRLNSIDMSNYHKDKYYYFKGYLKYFRIPTILFSAMNSVFSVGLQPYCPQPTISLLCCLISLICGVISSIELFLSIQNTMENELTSSKDFYLLSVDVFKMLSLERNTRMVNGKIYLDETYQTYCKLIENSNLVNTEIKNMIAPAFQPNPKLFSTIKAQITDIEMPESTINTNQIHTNDSTNEELFKSLSQFKAPLKKTEIKINKSQIKPNEEELIQEQIIQELTNNVVEEEKEPEVYLENVVVTDPENVIVTTSDIEESNNENVVLTTSDIEESNNENVKTKRKYTKKIK